MRQSDACIAANRFGLGARPGELKAIADDPRGWLIAQLDAPAPDALRERPGAAALVRQALQVRAEGTQEARRAYRDAAEAIYTADAEAWLQSAARGDAHFAERLVAFWSNHLAVSTQVSRTVALVGAYQREAIRPHITGRFEDMVLSSVRHPAMAFYLDSYRSTGPGSPAGRRREMGLNENLARELLELHTVGVGAGYGQPDVEAVAALLTGWGVGDSEDGFLFRKNHHQPGDKLLLGERYGEGYQEGERAVRALARHPATARRLSLKLARHFAADSPPPALVDALEATWLETGGDLEQVTRTLVARPEAWRAEGKVKSPLELVLSTARLLDPDAAEGAPLREATRALGQPIWRPDSPQGFPDTAAAWLGPASVLQRVEWGVSVAALAPRVEPVALAEAGLGAALSRRTRSALSASSTAEEGLALLLASPEFQRR